MSLASLVNIVNSQSDFAIPQLSGWVLQRYVAEKQVDSSFSDLGPLLALVWPKEAQKRSASARPFMLLINIITLLFCVAQNLVPEASAFFVGMETNAAILAVSIFMLIVFRVWVVAEVEVATSGVSRPHS